MLLVRAVHHDLLRRVAARSNQGSNNGGKEYNSPGAEPLWGRRMTAGRRKAPTMSQELQCSRPTFDSERPRVWKWGRQTSNVPRAPTNLVTSLTVIQYSFTLSMHLTWGVAQLHIYVGHNSWANWARLMHFCHIAANCLLTQTSVAFYTLHYGSISRGVMKGQWGRNYLGAESLWGRWNTAGALNDYGGAKKSQQFHTYILQYSTFASGRPQVRKWGRQTCILPRALSNLVMPLSIWRSVPSRNPSTHFCVAKRRCRQLRTHKLQWQ